MIYLSIYLALFILTALDAMAMETSFFCQERARSTSMEQDGTMLSGWEVTEVKTRVKSKFCDSSGPVVNPRVMHMMSDRSLPSRFVSAL